MQLSETVIAAMIGAIATVSTALFQLFSALRARNKLEVRPKKGRTARSVVAVIALMVASGVGGYLYAALRQQSASEDIRNMRDELKAQLQVLASTTERLAQARDNPAGVQAMSAATAQPNASVESVVYAPACQPGVSCGENTAQRLSLCGAIPSSTQVSKVELFARSAKSQTAWTEAAAAFEQDIGGGKFVGSPVEHANGDAAKAICVDFLHWSAEPHVARLVVQYGLESAPQSAQSETTAVAAMSTAAPVAPRASLVSSAP